MTQTKYQIKFGNLMDQIALMQAKMGFGKLKQEPYTLESEAEVDAIANRYGLTTLSVNDESLENRF